MFVTRSRYDALYRRYVEVVEERDEAREDARSASDSVIQLAARAGRDAAPTARALLGQVQASRRIARRLMRALRACARYRAEAAVLRRQLATVAYDNAVELDRPALDLGAGWQQRREDRPVVRQRGEAS